MSRISRDTLVKILIAVCSMLFTLGLTYASTVRDVNTNGIQIETIQKDIGKLSLSLETTLQLVSKVVDQNTLLINQIITHRNIAP